MTQHSMQAVIMAGGEGSRLRPLTSNIPKPMLPVANRPIMEHIVTLLRRHGFTDVVATVQFLSSVIRNYFVDGSDLGVSLSYATEDAPLGTAGSVLGARDLLSGTFLVISGDALTDIDLGAVIEAHRARGACATMVLKRSRDPLEFGIVMTGADGRVERLLEKPTWGQVFSDTINTGIYVLEPEVLDLIPADQPYDFSSELFPLMLDKGLPLFGFVSDAYWTDVGNTDSYLQVHRDVLGRRVHVEIPGFELRHDVWVGEDVEIHPSARLQGPALIGDNTRIEAHAAVGPFAVVGTNVIVGEDTRIVGGVVLDRAHLGPSAQVQGAVLGRAGSLDRGAILEDGAVLGDEVRVGADALVKPRVKIYPSRTVDAGAIVTHSVVRERRVSRGLFGPRGVAGRIDVGVTPQLAVRLGMAYGTMLKRGSTVVTGRDASRAARTMKRAIIAGLNSAGVTCHDLELAPMPLARFAVRSEQAAGGVSVVTSQRDREVVEIRLFDADGADLSPAQQRTIERIFFREDYRRAGAAALGELEFPPHVSEQYVAGLLRALDLATIRAAGLKIVADYAFGPAAVIGPAIMGRLGCDALALNAFVDEHRPVLTAGDLERLLGSLSDYVRYSQSHLGVLLEPGGEVAYLVDDRGRLVSFERALLAFLRHEAARDGATLAVPVSASTACARVVTEAGGSLVWTPTAVTSLMEHAAGENVGFAGNTEGSFIFPRFMPAPDALMTFGKALELIATSNRPLSDVIDHLPQVNIARRDVATPWERKGTVMRRIAASARGELVLIDGVKIVEGDRWVLVIPYPDEPLCKVWAEAPTMQEAEALAGRYAAKVERVAAEEGELI